MRLRDQVALTLPSFFLRVILGLTFLWAGTGKLVGTYSVSGDDAARLANIGVTLSPVPQQANPETTPQVTLPQEPAQQDSQSENKPEADLNEQANEIIETIEQQLEALPKSSAKPEAQPQAKLQSVQYNSKVYAGSDFPEPMNAKRVYSIALMIDRAANPGLTQNSLPIQPTLPSKLGAKPWPKILAWTAAITELVAGTFLLLGLMTRISALSTFAIMLMAMWMTQFGPAAIQSDNAILGFIPSVADPWSPSAYSDLLWQMALAAMSGAVFFLGSGALGIDRLIFKPSRRDPYIHGDLKASKPTSQPSPEADRSEFDRTPNPTP